MIAMPFNKQFAEGERDLDRAERLRAELPGIFNWALAGAVRLFSQGGFTHCGVCDRCAGEHRQHSDSFLEFMDEMVELGSGKRVLVDDFYQAYTEYCGAVAGTPKPRPRSASRSCGSLASPGRGKRQAPGSMSITALGSSLARYGASLRPSEVFNGSRSCPCPVPTDAGRAIGGTLPSRASKIRPSKTGSLGRRLTLENKGFLINPS